MFFERAEKLTSTPSCGKNNLAAIRSIERNNGHLARIKEEEDSPAALDVAEQYNNTDIGKAAMESQKVVIIIIILKNMSWTWFWGGDGLSH